MKHRGTALLGLVAGMVLAVLGWAAPAWAADVDRVSISGIGLAQTLVVPAETQPELCAALFAEVEWLLGRDGDAGEPEPDALGPLFVMMVYEDGDARHRFHLYPLAEDGPRVFQPASQPGDRTVDEEWHYGRIRMPETLVAAGVPVYDPDNPGAPGGAGGAVPGPDATEAPEEGSLLAFLDEWVEGMRLAGVVTVAVVFGLAGVALLIRRKV